MKLTTAKSCTPLLHQWGCSGCKSRIRRSFESIRVDAFSISALPARLAILIVAIVTRFEDYTRAGASSLSVLRARLAILIVASVTRFDRVAPSRDLPPSGCHEAPGGTSPAPPQHG